MNSLRTTHPHRAALTGLLLVAALAGTAAAAPYEFHFWQGPRDMIIPMNDFRQFHSTLTNTGEAADSYTLTVVREQPATWQFAVCYDGICWPEDQTVFTVPLAGSLAPGQTVDFDFDVTSLFAEGEAVYTLNLVSNNNPAAAHSFVFTAKSPTEPYALLFSPGENIIGTTVNNYVSFKPVLYNAGTEPDSYHLSFIRDLPENWSATYCYGDICYPDWQEEGEIPISGTIPGAGAVPLEFDFTTLFDEGTGAVVVTIRSNTDPSLVSVVTFFVTTGSVVAVEPATPPLLAAVQAAPNPFNPRTEIRFVVGGHEPRDATIDIFTASGHRVRSLPAAQLAPGPHAVTWDGLAQDGRPAAAGLYVARVQVGNVRQTVKLSLVK